MVIQRCGFLNLMRCQRMFAIGDVAEAGRTFHKLSPQMQESICCLITRSQSPALYVANCLLGRISRYLKMTTLDEKMAAVWEATSCHTKSMMLEQMIDQRVHKKLEQESHCAHRLVWQSREAAFTYASTQFPKPAIDWLFYPTLVVSVAIKVLILPWGLYSLYRYVKERDQYSREAGVASFQENGSSMPPVHLLSQSSVMMKEELRRLEFFGLFDGGQRPSTALFARSYFFNAFRDAIKQYAYCDQMDTAIFAALRSGCLAADSDAIGVITSAIVIGDHLWVCANGHTRVVFNDKGRPVPLCLEDSAANSSPRITKVPLSQIKGRELIIASRHFWSVCRSEQATEFVEANKGEMKSEQLARALVAKAHHAGCKESLAVLVVKF